MVQKESFQVENFNPQTMTSWAFDMGIIIDECMAIIRFGMREMEKEVFKKV